jgi:hypothetical protein
MMSVSLKFLSLFESATKPILHMDVVLITVNKHNILNPTKANELCRQSFLVDITIIKTAQMTEVV